MSFKKGVGLGQRKGRKVGTRGGCCGPSVCTSLASIRQRESETGSRDKVGEVGWGPMVIITTHRDNPWFSNTCIGNPESQGAFGGYH